MYVLLNDENTWRRDTQEEIVDLIREEVGNVPGVQANFTQPIEMSVDELLEGVKAELAIKLFGDDLDILKNKAEEIGAVLRQVQGARDVQVDQVSGTPQLLIRINRDAISRYGIPISQVQEIVRAAVGGEEAGQVYEGIRRYDILVRYSEEARNSPETIGQIIVPGPDDLQVPLSQLAAIETIIGPRQITRENNQRFITIQCNVADRDIGSFVAEAQVAIDQSVNLPPGYLTTWGGQFRLQQEANKRMAVVVPITVLLVALLLYSSFNSLKNTLLILLNIPLAMVGGIIGLWISGQNLSVPASVGFIALFGVAVLNGIVLVSFLNDLRLKGMPIKEVVIQGAMLRIRPVSTTALVAMLGLVPLLFSQGVGAEVQRPLATVVIGGLLTSTILTLLIIPAFYEWFSPKTEKEAA